MIVNLIEQQAPPAPVSRIIPEKFDEIILDNGGAGIKDTSAATKQPGRYEATMNKKKKTKPRMVDTRTSLTEAHHAIVAKLAADQGNSVAVLVRGIVGEWVLRQPLPSEGTPS